MVIALIALGFLSILLAWYVSKYDAPDLIIIAAKLGAAISSLIWLKVSLISMLGVLLFIQAIYVPAKNYFDGRNIWFMDNQSWIGQILTHYLGHIAGRTFYIVQLIFAIILIFIL